jgi:hypothetical protein
MRKQKSEVGGGRSEFNQKTRTEFLGGGSVDSRITPGIGLKVPRGCTPSGLARFIRATHSTIFALALLPLAVVPVAAQSPRALEPPPVSDNAALQYWQAFAMLPALDASQEKLLETPPDAPLNEAAVKLIDQSHASLLYLHRGAKLRKCDWGLDYRDGIDMLLPHVAKARTLARLAALDARRAFEAGQSERARDDAYGMFALARQVGGDHTLVSMLVCYSIEEMAIDAVAPYLPEVNASYDEAVKMFQTLPPSPPLSQGVFCEKLLTRSIIRQLQQAEERRAGSWRKIWQVGMEAPEPLRSVESLEKLVQYMEDFQSVYDELAQLTTFPPREFDAKYPAFVERAEAASPVAKLLLPAMQKVVAAQRHSQARTEMMLAAIAVIENGPEQLESIKDPFGDGPFEYRKLDEGFELSSMLEVEGKPVTLVIGQKKSLAAP